MYLKSKWAPWGTKKKGDASALLLFLAGVEGPPRFFFNCVFELPCYKTSKNAINLTPSKQIGEEKRSGGKKAAIVSMSPDGFF
jgi:hypothetical protein